MRERKNCIKSEDSGLVFFFFSLKTELTERKMATGLGSANQLFLFLSGHSHFSIWPSRDCARVCVCVYFSHLSHYGMGHNTL